jgi:hypothetical protein
MNLPELTRCCAYPVLSRQASVPPAAEKYAAARKNWKSGEK